MQNYLIIIEKSKNGFGAYAPDVEGCVAVGKTVEETMKNMQEALEFHIQSLIKDGLPVPEAVTQSAYAKVG
ncbi:MAG TPA: type II toxin-antitoxin system HicB family antitoxin [Candidatus Gastranaerophilales bacterium]|nr:type II toxin-antitoxin system HicB family antitoxin [Candidatus Gastranaerophilales bacterium]